MDREDTMLLARLAALAVASVVLAAWLGLLVRLFLAVAGL